ncbi:MAG: PEP-CTERM sorting domain-containing protein [Candidatus Omnitrophica bacterium]|nr:PEP-CTERM sorting domain-containing protein [Candidatus Omnitrophota bacterium]
MRKQLLIVILAVSATILFMPKNASALPGIIDMFTTDSFGSTTPHSSFDLDETPYLYMSLEIPEGVVANTVAAWNDPDSLAYFSVSALNMDTERWVTLTNWGDVKKTGEWTINANYFDSRGNNDVDSTAFTVTPEPATIGLLLMGGIPMLLRRKRKHTKNT